MKIDGACHCGDISFEAESGNRRTMAFCPTCGTQLWARNADGDPDRTNIRAGTLRQRAELPPRLQIWFRSARPWLAEITSLPSIEKQA